MSFTQHTPPHANNPNATTDGTVDKQDVQHSSSVQAVSVQNTMITVDQVPYGASVAIETTAANNTSDVQPYNLPEFLQPHSHLDLTGFISNRVLVASGGYADVYRGEMKKPGMGFLKVAVKRLRVYVGRSEEFEKDLKHELRVWLSLDHPNILPLLGIAIADEVPSLVSAWMEESTMSFYLRNHSESIDAEKKHEIVMGVVKGLCYLHECGVVHSDLKSDNILMTSDGVPMLSDFGISRVLLGSQTITGTGNLKGCIRWMARELLESGPITDSSHQHQLHTKASDVWAFGMVLYEMIVGKIPYFEFLSEFAILSQIFQRKVPHIPVGHVVSGYDAKLYLVLPKLWDFYSEKRPTMKFIVALLERLSCTVSESQSYLYQHLLLNVSSGVGTQHLLPSTTTIRCPLWFTSSAEDCFAIAVTSDSSKIATGSFGYVTIWSVETGKPLCGPLTGFKADDNELYKARIFNMCFSKNNQYLIAMSSASQCIVWDVRTGIKHCEPTTHQETIWCTGMEPFAFSDDSQQLTIQTGDASVGLWCMTKLKYIAQNDMPSYGKVENISPNGLLVVSISNDNKDMNIWDSFDGTLLKVITCGTCFKGSGNSILFSHDSSKVLHTVVRAKKLYLQILNISELEHSTVYNDMSLCITPEIQFSHSYSIMIPGSGNYILFGCFHELMVIDCTTISCIGQVQIPANYHFNFGVSYDCNVITTLSDKSELAAWDFQKLMESFSCKL